MLFKKLHEQSINLILDFSTALLCGVCIFCKKGNLCSNCSYRFVFNFPRGCKFCFFLKYCRKALTSLCTFLLGYWKSENNEDLDFFFPPTQMIDVMCRGLCPSAPHKGHFGCSNSRTSSCLSQLSDGNVTWKRGEDVWEHLPNMWCCPWRKVGTWITGTCPSWGQLLQLPVPPGWLTALALCDTVTALNYCSVQGRALGNGWFLHGDEGNLLIWLEREISVLSRALLALLLAPQTISLV